MRDLWPAAPDPYTLWRQAFVSGVHDPQTTIANSVHAFAIASANLDRDLVKGSGTALADLTAALAVDVQARGESAGGIVARYGTAVGNAAERVATLDVLSNAHPNTALYQGSVCQVAHI